MERSHEATEDIESAQAAETRRSGQLTAGTKEQREGFKELEPVSKDTDSFLVTPERMLKSDLPLFTSFVAFRSKI